MICKLCKTEAPLRRSHIIPEFLYLPLYDEKHRAVLITSTLGEKERTVQKGLRERLLCDACEGRINAWETPSARLFKGLAEAAVGAPPGATVLVSSDYATAKLFQLSILWRSSVASHEWFSEVALGPHEERVRRMLLTGNPGTRYDYGCLLVTAQGPNNLGTVMRSPRRLRVSGHTAYSFLLGGLYWFYVVSSHSNQFEGREDFASPRGLALRVSSKTERDILLMIRRNLKAIGKL